MEKKVLASAKFVAKCGDETYNVTLDLVPSSAFEYGNRHALIYKVDSQTTFFDARYDHRFDSAKTFKKYAYEFVRDLIMTKYTVEQVS